MKIEFKSNTKINQKLYNMSLENMLPDYEQICLILLR